MRSLPPQASGILSYFTRHRTAANLVLVALIVAGLFALPNMRAQFFPDVVVDDIDISARWDGAGAEDVDAAIVGVLEPVLLAVDGVVASEATAREGVANIRLEFEPSWDMARAADDVQQAVDSVTDLPQNADTPEVRRGTWRDRVTDVVITGPVAPAQLGRFADEFVARLFDQGVTRTTIRGVAAPQILIEVPTVRLIQYDLTMADIAAAIAAEVDTAPAGAVDGANARVRAGSAKRSAEEIAAIALIRDPNGRTVSIGDVARVMELAVDRESAYFVGGNPAMMVRVDRSDKGDAISIQATVEEIATQMEATLPQDVQIDLIRTRAEFISGRLEVLLSNGATGLALVLGLLFLFLNARTAFWVAAGIPVAMLAAIALMYAVGITLNMISLFALIITLGIVVDDAIVVGEHADYRHRALGEDPITAAETAARRMAAPVFAATLTTVLAFAGLAAIGGRFGDLIADIPFTVIVVLTASLVECFLILPNHMAHALAANAKDAWYDRPSRFVNHWFERLRGRYFRPFIDFAVKARYPVVAVMLLLLATQAASFLRGDVTWRFFNAPELSSVSGNFAMLDGAGREDSLAMLADMQRAVEAVASRYEAEHGRNPTSYVLAEIGGNTGGSLASADGKDSDLLGSISIELIDPDLRPYSSFAFVADLQNEVRQNPMVEEISFRGWRGGPGGDAIDVQITGAETEILKAGAEAVKTALLPFGEVSGLADDLPYDRQELSLSLTPRGEALGFEIEALGRILRNRLGGVEAASFPDGLRTATVRVELPQGELTADFLDRMLLRADGGSYVPLADIVSVETRTGFSTIRRENGQRVVSVTGDLSEDDPARAEEIMAQLRDQILPNIEAQFGVTTTLSGLAEQERAFLDDALAGFLACMVGIYIVLAWIFASWLRPLVVLCVIPFGLTGAIFGHWHWDVPLSMFTVVGLIGMTGIIINDSIVLVSTVDEYAKDRGLIPAVVDAACDRLRPILLTTLTTVLGLAPLLFETSSQAQFLKPTVITLVYGLGFGMFVVLLLVPAVLAIQADIGKRVRSLRRGLGHRGRIGQAGATLWLASLGVVLWWGLVMGGPILTGGAWGWGAALLPASALTAFLVFSLGVLILVLGLAAGVAYQNRKT